MLSNEPSRLLEYLFKSLKWWETPIEYFQKLHEKFSVYNCYIFENQNAADKVRLLAFYRTLQLTKRMVKVITKINNSFNKRV